MVLDMFLLREILLCAPLIIYTFLRIWRLIPQTLFKIFFTIIYILLLMAFPLVEMLSHASGMEWANFIIIPGYFSLPFLLYLILFVILSDLTLCMGRLTGILSKETVKRRGFQRNLLFLVLAVPLAVVVVGAIWNNHPQINAYSVEIPRKSSDLSQLKIGFVADFHLRETSSRRLMERFVEKINAANPDIILIGGDVLEGDRQGEKLGFFAAEFRRLKPKYGVYGIPGNHDLHAARAAYFFDQAGIRLLQDTVERIANAFYLIGRNDARIRGRKSINDLLKDCDGSLPVIVLDHRPTDLDNVSQSGSDILLSAHTHNGQLFPLNFLLKSRYELGWGYKLKNHTHIFVTSGIQVWGPPVRTSGDSEILIIDASFRNDL
jgi:predicted MPP superfamily phosphohydrolase